MSNDLTMAPVQDFLAQKRIALVGLSHDPAHWSHSVWKELAERGYDLVPVNPAHAGETLEGRATLAHVAEAEPPVDGVLVMTPAGASADAVRDALAAGVRRVWLYQGAGQGAVSDEAVALATEAGAALIPGACPLMFLRDANWVHRLHGWAQKVAGTYPH